MPEQSFSQAPAVAFAGRTTALIAISRRLPVLKANRYNACLRAPAYRAVRGADVDTQAERLDGVLHHSLTLNLEISGFQFMKFEDGCQQKKGEKIKERIVERIGSSTSFSIVAGYAFTSSSKRSVTKSLDLRNVVMYIH